jgi:hypothetical protein
MDGKVASELNRLATSKGRLMQEYLLDGKAIRLVLVVTIPFIMMISSCEHSWLALGLSLQIVSRRPSLLPISHWFPLANARAYRSAQAKQQVLFRREADNSAGSPSKLYGDHPSLQGVIRHCH